MPLRNLAQRFGTFDKLLSFFLSSLNGRSTQKRCEMNAENCKFTLNSQANYNIRLREMEREREGERDEEQKNSLRCIKIVV